MIQFRSLRWRHLFFFLLLVNVHLAAKAVPDDFETLRSKFMTQAGTLTQPEMLEILLTIQSLAETPMDLGNVELLNTLYHLRGSRLGLALIAGEKAIEVFDSLGAEKLTISALLMEVDIYHKLGDPENMKAAINRAVELGKNFPDDPIQAKIFRMRGATHLDVGQLDSTHIFEAQAIALALEHGDSIEYAWAVYLDAVAYQLQGKSKEALQNLLKLEKVAPRLPNYGLQVQYWNFYGMVSMAVDQNENAIKAYQNGVLIAREQGMRWQECTAMNSLGIGLKAVGDTVGAIENFEAALKIAVELGQDGVISSIYSGLADIHIGLGNWEAAGDFANEGLNYSRQAGSIRMESYALMRLAEVGIHGAEYEVALAHLALADSLTRIMGNWWRIRAINDLRAEACEKLGDMDQALYFQRLAMQAQDSVEYREGKVFADSVAQARLSGAEVEVRGEPADAEGGGNLWIWVLGLLVLVLAGVLLGWRRKPGASPDVAAAVQPDNPNPDAVARVVQLLRENKDWAGFMLQFETIHPGLLTKMGQRHPDLTPTDVRILALSRLGLSADELGELLGISTESAKKARYRTRKRLGISSDQSLLQYMLQG